ncbi:hydrogenase maturation protease [Myxococcota bacterium]|nr:hydrogenase maturation protease [Myxococcota bacterium]
MRPRLVALGNPYRGDDGAAIRAARVLAGEGFEVVVAGRPGPGLLDWLPEDRPAVLADVVAGGGAPGTVVRLPLAGVAAASLASPRLSSHGLGPGDALRLAAALGRGLPEGEFVGIEGERFAPGEELSPAVEAALPAYVEALREALRAFPGR